jgi:hypothetical protein
MSSLRKLWIAGTALLVNFAATGRPVAAADAPQCLRTEDIKSTKATDDSTLLFYTRDHKIWVNHLQSPCLGLVNDGFSYNAEPTDIICGNVETIRTLQFPTVCKLGAFAPYTQAAAPVPATR